MLFKIQKEKDTGKKYWCATIVGKGQTERDQFWLIYPHGAGFDLFRKIGYGRAAEKLCHVQKFDSAKKIANLIQNDGEQQKQK